MKKTQRKDAIRNIWKKKVSWISIVIVTMLTVGVFMGCRFFNMSTERDGTAYYKKHNFIYYSFCNDGFNYDCSWQYLSV